MVISVSKANRIRRTPRAARTTVQPRAPATCHIASLMIAYVYSALTLVLHVFFPLLS